MNAGPENLGTNLASERHEVVLTQAGYLDVPDKHHFLVVFLEDSVIDDICRRVSRRSGINKTFKTHSPARRSS